MNYPIDSLSSGLLSLPLDLMREIFDGRHPCEGVILRFVSKLLRSILGPPSRRLCQMKYKMDLSLGTARFSPIRMWILRNSPFDAPENFARNLAVVYAVRNGYDALLRWLLEKNAPCSPAIWKYLFVTQFHGVMAIYQSATRNCVCDCHSGNPLDLAWCICKALGCHHPRGTIYGHSVGHVRFDLDASIRTIPGFYRRLPAPDENDQ